MGVSFDREVDWFGSVQTTNASATDVPGLSWTVAEKTLETYEIEAWAVRDNASGPNVIHQKIVGSARRADVASVDLPAISGGDTNPKTIFKHALNADTAVKIDFVVSGTSVKVQATGLVSTTINWRIRVRRTVLTST